MPVPIRTDTNTVAGSTTNPIGGVALDDAPRTGGSGSGKAATLAKFALYDRTIENLVKQNDNLVKQNDDFRAYQADFELQIAELGDRLDHQAHENRALSQSVEEIRYQLANRRIFNRAAGAIKNRRARTDDGNDGDNSDDDDEDDDIDSNEDLSGNTGIRS